jgi:hypothetical protein
MLVFDLPTRSPGAPLRAAALGSCRVREPFTALAERGQLPLVAGGLQKSHTAREALLLLDIAAGGLEIEDFVLPLMFSHGALPSPTKLREALNVAIDVVVLEVSSLNQFFYHGIPIHSAFLNNKLVQPNARALLNWYRQVCTRGSADAACVEATLAAMGPRGGEFDHIEDLLRGIRLERQGVDQIETSLREMMSRVGGRWVLVGPFVVAGGAGAVMAERRALLAELDAAAERCVVSRWDPSRLISAFGREAVLNNKGRNLYHYARAFLPTAGEALLDVMRDAAGR